MKKNLILTLLIVSFNLFAQSPSYLNSPTNLEEKFEYNVSWSFIHLGTITLRVENIESFPDLRKVIVTIKTAPHLPFINIDEYNVAVLRITDGMTLYYHGTEEQDGRDADVVYVFDEDKKITSYTIRSLATHKLIKCDLIKFSGPYLIGTSLIEYARLIAEPGLIKNVPTMLRGKFYPTIINYCGPVEEIEIDACEKPVRAFKYTGNADWGGNAVAGLSGEFTGWLSDDSSKVVLRAEMEIFLGSINVELEKWYKPGWRLPTPVKYTSDSIR